jgi:rhodanese-related sulfurtransferase/DNA-binding MarR family transcriptional regulator
MTDTNFKKELFGQFALIAKSLSNGHRLELLEFLAQGERGVEDLAKVANLSVANTSQHLQSLRRCGLVETRSEGHYVFYRLSNYEIMNAIRAIQKVAESNLSAIDDLISVYLASKDDLEPMSRNELLTKAKKGLITVIDVRPEIEYAAGHIPEAVNIPLSKLEHKLSDIPQGKEVIAYCRGAYCILSFEAVEKLRSLGYKARRLEEGFPEWKLAALQVE